LKYEKAKKEFIQSREMLAMTSTSKFFNLVDAQIQLKIAENNLANADTLYKIGTGRFQVGTVTQDELLNLQLGLLNAGSFQQSPTGRSALSVGPKLVPGDWEKFDHRMYCSFPDPGYSG
jgi:hypothetical protein